jgi:hypothetical protein
MIRYSLIFLLLSIVACNSEQKETKKLPELIGTWCSRTTWNNNTITLKVRPDSTILFKVQKDFCPGTKYFITIGEWHIEKDSVLVFDQIQDTTRRYKGRDLFPELFVSADSINVMALPVSSAKYVFRNGNLHNMGTKGEAVLTEVFDRIKE